MKNNNGWLETYNSMISIDSELSNVMAKTIDLIEMGEDTDDRINSMLSILTGNIVMLKLDCKLLYNDMVYITLLSELYAFTNLVSIRKSRVFNVSERLTMMFTTYQQLIESIIKSLYTSGKRIELVN